MMRYRWLGLLLFSAWVSAQPLQKLTVVLDWFVNPDHAPLFVAEQQGFYRDQGLQVEFITPADPSDAPKWVAVGKANLAVDYQPHFLLETAQNLPLTQVGTLIDQPLGCLAVLKTSAIQNLKQLRGKRIGYSDASIDPVVVRMMLKHNGLRLEDVELINVHYNLVQALLSGQVDAVVGVMRNVETVELARAGHPIQCFYPEKNGFSTYSELILVAQNKKAKDPRIAKFLAALQQGAAYLRAHPQTSWQTFAKNHPELNNDLNRDIWNATLPYFAADPTAFNRAACLDLANTLANGLQMKRQSLEQGCAVNS